MKKVIKKLIPKSFYRVAEPKLHLLEAFAYTLKNNHPAKGMNIIGVTGTNGKTSTCFMIHKMLVEAGVKTGLMTTVAYGVDNDITLQKEHVTTVSAPVLQKRLADFKKQGVQWVVVETTSHALAQHRVFGLPFKIGVLTNITHEHLDYHGTFKRYAEAKRKLFEIVNKNKGVSIINADDSESMKATKNIKNCITYGIKQGDFKAKNVKLTPAKSDYEVEVDDQKYKIRCNIPGKFNVYNSLAAVLVGREIGLSKGKIEKGIAALETIEGRMNVINEGQPFTAIVDFAHTPDAFENLLSELRQSAKGKLVVLFGSAGRRDKSKRSIQGEIAGKYADELILTEEDDRDEDGNEILLQIAKGAKKTGKKIDKNIFLVLRREEAIKFAVTRVKDTKDVVVFLGKGHEKTIERADGEHTWNEIELVKRALRNKN